LLFVLVLSFVGTLLGLCPSSLLFDYNLCLGTSGGNICQCFNTFKQSAIVSGCTLEEYYPMCLTASIGCVSVTDCTSGIPPKTCIEAFTQKSFCLAQALLDKNKMCKCYSDYEAAAATLCTSGVDIQFRLGNCTSTNLLCPGACTFDCKALQSYLPSCETTFQGCTDKCTCYSQFSTCIFDSIDVCDVSKLANLKVCVEAQVACQTFVSVCDSSQISISIPDVVALYNKYKTEFITLWNKGLVKVQTVVEDCIQVTTQNKVSFTVTVSWNDTQVSISQVIDAIKVEFSSSLGVKSSQITAYQQTHVSAGKRATTENIIVELNADSSSTSMVTVFIAPIILFNGLLLWFFNH